MRRKAANGNRPGAPGFTLIEFLIALVVIGFIVTLLVNFFISPLKLAALNTAVSKITDDMHVLYDAQQKYYAACGGELTAMAQLAAPACGQSPPLSHLPVAPVKALAGNSPGYVLDTASYQVWGDPGSADVVALLSNVTEDVCRQVNLNAGIIPPLPTGSVPQLGAGLQCIKTDDGLWTVVKPLDVK